MNVLPFRHRASAPLDIRGIKHIVNYPINPSYDNRSSAEIGAVDFTNGEVFLQEAANQHACSNLPLTASACRIDR